MTTLLAVDDSKTMRKVLEITFSGETFQTRIASNAQEAFGELAEHPVSVALIDVTLPFESGYEVCKRVKAEYPAVRVLLLSSKQNPYDPSRGVGCGADDHLDKPFDTQVLLDKVKSLVNRPVVAPATATPPPTTFGSDSRSPTAMPAGFDDEPVDSQDPILIPIDDEEPLAASPSPELAPLREMQSPLKPALPLSAAIEAATNAPTRLPGTFATATHRADLTMPAAAAPTSGNGSSAINQLESRLSNLGLTEDQIVGVLALSREVVEAAVWEVVPTLAEVLIKEEIRRLTQA